MEGVTAVIAYAARFLPRLPMERSQTVLLKVGSYGMHNTAYGVFGVTSRL